MSEADLADLSGLIGIGAFAIGALIGLVAALITISAKGDR